MSGRGHEPEGRFRDFFEPTPAPKPTAAERQVYALRIRAEPWVGKDEDRKLKALLKSMLRAFGFRCIDIKPDKAP